MPETVGERHFRDRLLSVQRLAAAGGSGGEGMAWHDYQDLVALCFDLSISGRELLDKEYRRIFKDVDLTVGWLQERRRVLVELSDDYVSLAETVRAAANDGWKAAEYQHGQALAMGLKDAIETVVEAKRALLDRWPVGDASEIAAAKAAIARGETEDAASAFAEIAGTDAETWRTSVEEYKQRRRSIAE